MSTPVERLVAAAAEAADELEALSRYLGLKACDGIAARLRAALADMPYAPPASTADEVLGFR